LTQEEADDVPTERLQKMAWTMQKKLGEMAQANATARMVQEQRAPDPVLDEDETAIADLEKEGVDPRFTKILRNLKGKAAKADAIEKQIQERDQLTLFSVIDDAFESLGPGAERIVGKGSGFDLKDKPEMARRQAIINSTNTDLRKLTPRAIKDAIARAYSTLYPSAPTASAPADAGPYKIEGKPAVSKDDWDASVPSAPPAGRGNQQEPEGEQKAVNNLAKRMNKPSTYEDDEEIKSGLFGYKPNGIPG
jgi:hypothetical protein